MHFVSVYIFFKSLNHLQVHNANGEFLLIVNDCTMKNILMGIK